MIRLIDRRIGDKGSNQGGCWHLTGLPRAITKPSMSLVVNRASRRKMARRKAMRKLYTFHFHNGTS
jgi:hypothetical protein